MRKYILISNRLRVAHIVSIKASQLPSVGKPKPGRTSPKSKLKMTKAKPNVKYKSTKPIASKTTTTFKNKSNL